MRKGVALVVGATGITGSNLSNQLIANGWTVYGLSRRPATEVSYIPVAADLFDAQSLKSALSGLPVTHVFFCTWTRRDTEQENVEANSTMMRNLFSALTDAPLVHATLVTGTKHYLGSFENYGSGQAETPFRESEPRQPGANFYYSLEDILYGIAEQRGLTWSVHRPHTVIGHARGNAMNIGVTLGVYASLCKAAGEPFVFPGSRLQWNALTDMTDATLLARQIEWAATAPGAANQAFNTVNGDTFRWRWMWGEIAQFFGIENGGCPEEPAPLDARMTDAKTRWASLAKSHGLVESDVDKLVSWWHTDADLGRELECVNDMNKSRDFGFEVTRDTRAALLDLFTRLQAEKVLPRL
jgi:nucleoside-diphosphate-sugar epimerase